MNTSNKNIRLVFLILVLGIVFISGCTNDTEPIPTTTTTTTTIKLIETTTTTKQKLTDDEIKSIVYQAIRKYIPESKIKDYEHEIRAYEYCGEYWYYPEKNVKWKETVVSATIQVCDYDNEPYELDYILSTYVELNPQETYIKDIGKGEVLINDRKVEFDDEQGRYDFSMKFPCQDKYLIEIYTTDFYGDNTWSIYEEYDIDKVSFEEMVNEILGHC